ncbi:protein FAM227A [Arvicola amphibius]|uniref:protein FAM227A n=1 Tax=Arvicola amphibius TaxID=1047088 RepID=UPI001C08010E|nr:protein FAM227A [Arvicola amphibius]
MEFAKKMDVINVTALPMIPLDEHQVVSVNARKVLENSLRKQLQDHPPISLATCLPACIIGSMSQMNQKITEIDLCPSLWVSISAIEEYELEKKSLKEKTHGSLGDRAGRPKEESPISCKGSELRNAKMILTKRKRADKNLLAELYQYPPFDETRPNRLPNGVDFCDMVGNVIRSEKNPLSGKSYCLDRELEKFLSSPPLSAIWLDSFWWLFHERYQPNKEIQNKLFDRIARNYALLLFNTVRSHYEEALIKRLPSLLSKALYTSFCCCFPQSWFNTHEFKSEICNTMGLWISGTYPCPKSYDNWDYSELDPERFRREELMLQSSRLIRGRAFTLFTCKRASIQKAEQNKNKKFHHVPVSREHRPGPEALAPVHSPPGHQSPKHQFLSLLILSDVSGRCEAWEGVQRGEQCESLPGSDKHLSVQDIPVTEPSTQVSRVPGLPTLFISQALHPWSPVYFATQVLGLSSCATLGKDMLPCITLTDQPATALISRKATPQVKRISEARAYMSLLLKKSHPACKSPKLTSNQFNLYGKSPLIVYFFLNYSKLQLNGQDVLVSRREKTNVVPDSAMTYADIILLVMKNMETRKRKLKRLYQLHEDEWTCFNNYLMELQENFEREVNIINQRAAERKRAKHSFLTPSLLFDDLLDKKSKGNPQRETPFLSRKKQKEVEEKQRVFQSPFSLQSTVDNYSLGLRSPYRIGSASSSSKRNTKISRIKQEMLFRLSPTSME